MKMKFVAFFLTIVILVVVDAIPVEEDVNSPIERPFTESNNALDLTTRQRQLSQRSAIAVDGNTIDSPPPVVTYTRWENSSCSPGANIVYQGVTAGGSNSDKGSPANLLCLPPTPMHYSNSIGGSSPIYGVEYQTSGPLDHADDRNMPCAVCEVTGKSTTLMIPSHYECPSGWRHEYNGYIMAGIRNQEGSSMYNCIDAGLEQVPGSGLALSIHNICRKYQRISTV